MYSPRVPCSDILLGRLLGHWTKELGVCNYCEVGTGTGSRRGKEYKDGMNVKVLAFKYTRNGVLDSNMVVHKGKSSL